MHAALTSFALVAVAELGDKTQILAFALAAKFRKPIPILCGIAVAATLNHSLASSLGVWLSGHISERALSAVVGLTFIAFAIWILRPDSLNMGFLGGKFSRWGAFGSTTVLFFIAETGDRTQLATIALAARFHSAIPVTIGATLGMLTSDGLAVILGDKLALGEIWQRRIRWISAALFFAFGVISLAHLARLP